MLSLLRSAAHALLNRDSVVAVPPMDGPFKPNNKLEQAERLFALADVDSLGIAGGAAYCSAGRRLYRLEARGGIVAPVEARSYDGRISFFAGAADGRLVVGVEGEGLYVTDGAGAERRLALPEPMASGLTAGSILDEGRVVVCVGSSRHPAGEWKRDLMENGASGMVALVDVRDGGVRIIAEKLAYPCGALALDPERVLISESWHHRVLVVSTSGRPAPTPLLDQLPAYPARLASATDGGFWLALFAPRRQLFELLLIENDFRAEMMATVDADEWIGPDLRASDAANQPLQQGAVRQMGIVKPWAPSRSYGLVVRCDKDGAPIASWHSRADGTLHGVTSIAEWGGDLLFASRGAGVVARLCAIGLDHD